MTNAYPSALSLAVAIAINSSMLTTQALADRRLQIKSIDIQSDKHVVFTQSEFIVRPTLDDDQQPIPKSYTTTYPDPVFSGLRAGYIGPAGGFTNILSDFDCQVSSVDLFETGENDVAQKYTKVLKVGDEGVFRFSHNLEEKKLVIEVRGGMTDQDSVEVVLSQWADMKSLEPLTEIARPTQMLAVLESVDERAGNLGSRDHYVALATIEVDKVDVDGRTFMRLISGGDRPPEPERLGQSLFVNDEVLLAAATSAYVQVHVLGGELQQEALNKLLSYHKPVGYVVHVEDNTQAYPVPAGYPKLEVTEAPGEIIVFHGQKQSAADIAFVETFNNLLAAAEGNDPIHKVTTEIEEHKVNNYRYVIRSRQMAVLEEFVARHEAGVNKDQMTLAQEDKLTAIALANYESLQQALSSATPDKTHKFELTLEHIKAASSVITPAWMQDQLLKHFSFKPVLRNLLTDQHSVQKILSYIPNVVSFSDNMARQLTETDDELERQVLDARSVYNSEMAILLGIDDWDDTWSPDEQAIRLLEKINDMHRALANAHSIQQYQQQQTDLSDPEKLALVKERQQSTSTEAEKSAEIRARFAALAEHLNVQNFDSNTDIDAQQERLIQSIQNLNAQATEDEACVKLRKDTLREVLGFTLIEGNRLEDRQVLSEDTKHGDDRLAGVENPPEFKLEVLHKLSALEAALDMDVLGREDDEYSRRQAISEEIQTFITKARQRTEEEALELLKNAEGILGIEVNEGDHDEKRLHRVLTKLVSDDITEKKLDHLEHAFRQEDFIPENEYWKDKIRRLGKRLVFYIEGAGHRALQEQTRMLETVEDELGIDTSKNVAAKKASQTFIAPLANALEIEFEKDASLNEQKEVMAAKIQALIYQLDELYDNEGIIRTRNNEIAHRLGIGNYKDDAAVDVQSNLIKETLQYLHEIVLKVDQPEVHERIAAINAELDRQMARLGPKPRFVLDRDLAMTSRALKEAESELTDVHRKLNEIRGKNVLFAGNRADVQHISDEDDMLFTKAMKQLQTGLGLAAGDEQRPAGRIEDIMHFLGRYSKATRNEILEQLGAKTDTNLKMRGDVESFREDDDYFVIFRSNPDNNDQDQDDKVAEPLGELPLAKAKYIQVRQFLRRHDKKNRQVTSALLEERNARENLELKKEEIKRFENTDEKTEAVYKKEIVQLNKALEQKSKAVAKAEEDLTDLEAHLDSMERLIGLKPDATNTNEYRVNALRNRQAELGGDDGTGGYIQQLTQEQARLEQEIETRQADVERLKEALGAAEEAPGTAEEALENEGSPCQYTPGQLKVLTDMHTFMEQHPLKKQALHVALGLAELAAKKPENIRPLSSLDFDDEFAPIRLQALAGDDLTFGQASRIVEFFTRLKTNFPERPFEPVEDRPLNVLEAVQTLANRARKEMKTESQQYNDEINGMAKTAIHFVKDAPGKLKDFPEYFATHSASGNKIITLLREGVISKIELENYMKAVKGADGYQTVDEFEHFLGYQHGVKVLKFRKVVRMLSDRGIDEFLESAFNPVTVAGAAGIKASVVDMKEYAVAVIANYVLDDIAFDNGRRTTAFLANVQDTLTPYANAAGLSESELIKAVHDTLMQAHAAAVEQQLNDYWVKPSAFLVQAVTWYFSSYKPLLATQTPWQAATLSLSNMAFLYLLDLTNRGDYLHRMVIPFQHWLERFGIDLDRTKQYADHSRIEQISEVGGLAMPLGKAASSVILLKTGSMLFARQYNANPQMYRSMSRLVPEIMKSIGSGQGIQVPVLHRVTPQKVKTLASATAGLVLGPVATFGTYAHGLLSGFTYAQTFGFALASSLTYDFFMNDNKMLTQWLGGPLGRALDSINRWRSIGETQDEYVKRTVIATPQRFSETDEAYANRVRAGNKMYGWTLHENYLQFRERRDRTMKIFENGWEKYFREIVPKWSFSHAESIPYSYTLGAIYQ
ncbi:hypothetical protein [Endozoicomonas sp. 8E]|uniref:hypothetical protein n=1 Tax=Endozoicomonas sp. 8E TaxID=3035692 RepID=UPI002939365C|nr:hypothetical protein [Endozoicomonas sp. 8E]WOG29574.1 hypothetical protein P6910_07960 [Endozoicomonas sp. 8E]